VVNILDKKWDVVGTKYRSNFPCIVSKNPSRVSLGFEWEVEMDTDVSRERMSSNCDCDPDWGCDCDEDEAEVETLLNTTSNSFTNTHGFRTHIECGGVEFASPVFNNISTARAMARRIKVMAKQDSLFNADAAELCGIHVHTGHAGWKEHNSEKPTYHKVVAMLNRKSSAQFIYHFAGRGDRHDYYRQAVALEWDESGRETPTADQKDDMLYREMVRPNRFGDKATIEYRIWNGVSDRLLPALDFAHACTSFVLDFNDDKGIPYLKDFKTWVDKQAGYKTLKQDPSWVAYA
tara:strand:+ start:1012 stop:1884 length:873 start_codon:yes stop_codon:yes gene_type:complete